MFLEIGICSKPVVGIWWATATREWDCALLWGPINPKDLTKFIVWRRNMLVSRRLLMDSQTFRIWTPIVDNNVHPQLVPANVCRKVWTLKIAEKNYISTITPQSSHSLYTITLLAPWTLQAPIALPHHTHLVIPTLKEVPLSSLTTTTWDLSPPPSAVGLSSNASYPCIWPAKLNAHWPFMESPFDHAMDEFTEWLTMLVIFFQ